MKNDCPDKRIGFFAERCRGAGVEVSVQSASIGIVRAVRHYLSEKNSVHMLSCLLLGIIKGVIPYFNDSFCI